VGKTGLKRSLYIAVIAGVSVFGVLTRAAEVTSDQPSDQSSLLNLVCEYTLAQDLKNKGNSTSALPQSFEAIAIDHINSPADLARLFDEYRLYNSYYFKRALVAMFPREWDENKISFNDWRWPQKEYERLQKSMERITAISESANERLELSKNAIRYVMRFLEKKLSESKEKEFHQTFLNLMAALLASDQKSNYLGVVFPEIYKGIRLDYIDIREKALAGELKSETRRYNDMSSRGAPWFRGRKKFLADHRALQSSIPKLRVAYAEAHAEWLKLGPEIKRWEASGLYREYRPQVYDYERISPLNFESLAIYEIALFGKYSESSLGTLLSSFRVLAHNLDIEKPWNNILLASNELEQEFSRVNRLQLVSQLTTFQVQLSRLKAKHDEIERAFNESMASLEISINNGIHILDSNVIQIKNKALLERQFSLLEYRVQSLQKIKEKSKLEFESLSTMDKIINAALDVLNEAIKIIPTMHDTREWSRYSALLKELIENLGSDGNG